MQLLPSTAVDICTIFLLPHSSLLHLLSYFLVFIDLPATVKYFGRSNVAQVYSNEVDLFLPTE